MTGPGNCGRVVRSEVYGDVTVFEVPGDHFSILMGFSDFRYSGDNEAQVIGQMEKPNEVDRYRMSGRSRKPVILKSAEGEYAGGFLDEHGMRGMGAIAQLHDTLGKLRETQTNL